LPKGGQKPGLAAIIPISHDTPEEYDTSVLLPGTKQLPGMPGKCRAIKAHQDEFGLCTTNQQRLIIQSQPTAILPICNVDYREIRSQLLARGDQPMRSIFVS
jgi:hypothetical protein